MELRFRITHSNLKHTAVVFSALAGENSLRILLFLQEKQASFLEIHKHTAFRKPSSTYKALERLTKAGIITKTYNHNRKKIVYSGQNS